LICKEAKLGRDVILPQRKEKQSVLRRDLPGRWKMERKPVFASRSSVAQKRSKPKQTFAAKPDPYSFVSNKKAPITQHDRGF
jgi:hypothetical protein